LLFFCCLAATTRGQYVTSGKIEYERKINLHAKWKDLNEGDYDSWYESIKAEMPKFDIAYFDLTFNQYKSLYKPGQEVENKPKTYGSEPASDNTVYTDLAAKRVQARKGVFEQKFLVEDSMRKMDWRIKDDIRMIANYKCRKAVGRICDSVYVVAFYTEDIAASSGPELFGNLPGMILELAIPRLHTTWTATKVELVPVTEDDFKIPDKGKKVSSKELFETVQHSLKDWGKWGTRYVWLTVL
jgi:GLPGLI family protein